MKTSRKLKIAFFVQLFPKLSETFILDQMTNLIKDGHQIEIFPELFINESKLHKSILDYNLLSMAHYPVRMPGNSWLGMLKLAWLVIINLNQIETFQKLFEHPRFKRADYRTKVYLFSIVMPFIDVKSYDIIHCHFGPSGVRATFIKALGLLEGRMVTTFHGYDVNLTEIRRDYYQDLFTCCDFFTANTKYTLKKAILLGCRQDKSAILPIGIDLEYFKPEKRKRESVKLLTIGRLVEKKGIKFGIKAFKILAGEYPQLTYDIIGDGILSNDLNQLIRELHLSDRVIIHGAEDRLAIWDFLNESDIFILPSVTAADGNSEGQAVVLQEAQAMQLPVVATLHNGIPEGVLNNISGFLVPEKDVEALAEKIKVLVADPMLRTKMGRSGRQFVEEQFNIKILHKRLIDIYLRILNY